MHSLRAVLLATLTLCGFAVAVPTAAAPTPTVPTDTSSNVFQSQENVSTSNVSLGAEISSFMQVSTSQTKGTIETGLWAARFNNTENESAKKKLVRSQVGDIRTRLDSLRERKQTLVERRASGNISRLKYQAEMSEVIGQIRSLEHAINATKSRATTVGTGVEDLQQLDKQADTVGGPEVAEVARSLNSVSTPGENNSTGGPNVGNGTVPDVGNNTTVGVGNGNGSAIGNGNNSTVGNGNNSTVGNGNGSAIGNGNNSTDNGSDGNGGGPFGDGLSIIP
ncbi:DUF7096 domain-containing protein [Haladaptatus salinisoli]|uniref:DUF7096 domain-containing protein n=1 Tax=Haladaptatus salinisoli TaxID=2884876 RepID=UPI001D0A4A28|nr:hypothetical protein [Haladaptatus salinisoli]